MTYKAKFTSVIQVVRFKYFQFLLANERYHLYPLSKPKGLHKDHLKGVQYIRYDCVE